MSKYKNTLQKLLSYADIQINGSRPWDIHINNDNVYSRVLSQASLGLGESYMEGWWDCSSLDQLFTKIIRANLNKKIPSISLLLTSLKAKFFNLQNIKKSFFNASTHYEKGLDLFEAMLDKHMAYSSGYWKDAKTLDRAQEDKLELVCKKLKLEPGMKVLDIGSGWGSFVKYAAEKYGIEAVGITVSKEQAEFAEKRCKNLPIKIVLQDYRQTEGLFDAITSIGMFEHVGPKNYKIYMKKAHSLLKDNDIFLLHTIGRNTTVKYPDPWLDKYIFPGGLLPSINLISNSIENLFVMEDWHNFGSDYDLTLMAWYDNFEKNWPKLQSKYDQKFYRMWKYYLLSCAGCFRARHGQLWQITLTKTGLPKSTHFIR